MNIHPSAGADPGFLKGGGHLRSVLYGVRGKYTTASNIGPTQGKFNHWGTHVEFSHQHIALEV